MRAKKKKEELKQMRKEVKGISSYTLRVKNRKKYVFGKEVYYCPGCGSYKARDKYHVSRTTKIGIAPYCIPCTTYLFHNKCTPMQAMGKRFRDTLECEDESKKIDKEEYIKQIKIKRYLKDTGLLAIPVPYRSGQKDINELISD